MISIAYAIARLIKDQLHKAHLIKGDRPFSSGRPLLGAARAARHARAAWLALGALAGRLPPKGGHPLPQAPAHAHRSAFVQRASRQLQVAFWGVCTASDLYASRVGVWAGCSRPALLAPAGVGGKTIGILLGEKGKRTLSDQRPLGSVRRSPIDVSGAGALALMRAPALPCAPGCRPAVMGWRP